MEPVPWPRAFDDPGWLWQLKWDGVRCLALSHPQGCRLWSRSGHRREETFPEIAAALADATGGEGALLDGEIVALDEGGQPNFQRVMRRALLVRPTVGAIRSVPVVYAVFDILELAGCDLRPQGLEDRQRALDEILRPSGPLHRVRGDVGGGSTFLRGVRARNLEGAVAKRLGSPYVPGHSPHWRKIKCRRTLQALITGYDTTHEDRLRSLCLGLRPSDDPLPTYIGNAGSGIAPSAADDLLAVLRRLPDAPPPHGARPAPRRRWVAPLLATTVVFAEFTSDGILRAPVVREIGPAPSP